MRAGDLRDRVMLQKPALGKDSIGQPFDDWQDVALIWADIRYLSGLSAINAGADTSTTRASVRVRYRSVSASQRFKHGNQFLNITAVLPDHKKEYVDLTCEVVNAET